MIQCGIGGIEGGLVQRGIRERKLLRRILVIPDKVSQTDGADPVEIEGRLEGHEGIAHEQQQAASFTFPDERMGRFKEVRP